MFLILYQEASSEIMGNMNTNPAQKWKAISNIASFEVRVGDINYGGHMGNDKALLLFQDARIRFLESLGFSEKSIGEETAIIMTDAHVFFKKEIFLHDQLETDVSISDVTTTSFNMEYTVRRQSDQVVVLTGSTRILAFNYGKRRVVRLPDEFLDKIKH